MKSSISPSTNNTQGKSLEMATRVTNNPIKQHTSRPTSTESTINQVNLFFLKYFYFILFLVT